MVLSTSCILNCMIRSSCCRRIVSHLHRGFDDLDTLAPEYEYLMQHSPRDPQYPFLIAGEISSHNAPHYKYQVWQSSSVSYLSQYALQICDRIEVTGWCFRLLEAPLRWCENLSWKSLDKRGSSCFSPHLVGGAWNWFVLCCYSSFVSSPQDGTGSRLGKNLVYSIPYIVLILWYGTVVGFRYI